MTVINRKFVSDSAQFLEHACSWPLGFTEFDTLCRLVAMLPADTLLGHLQVRVDERNGQEVFESTFDADVLKNLAAEGYISIRSPGDGVVQIDLDPLLADIGLCLVIMAKSSKRAWVVYKRFPEDPIAILDVDHELPDGKPIAVLTRSFWRKISNKTVMRPWTVTQLIGQLREDLVDSTSIAAE